jgi:hypothetical protein
MMTIKRNEDSTTASRCMHHLFYQLDFLGNGFTNLVFDYSK